MQMFKAVIATLFIALLYNQTAASLSSKPFDEEDMLHTEGNKIFNVSGKDDITLRGVNIGSWLLIEPWIINGDGQACINTEKEIWDLISVRFGEEKKIDLMNTFRDIWLTEKDTQLISKEGLNCVRLPIWWRVTNDSQYGGDLSYINSCIEWCKNNNIYIILDLHGAPGGQSNDCLIVGEPSNASLWNDEKYINQTIDFWKMISDQYKDESTIAGYDLLNEPRPYASNESTCLDIEKIIKLYDRIYDVIRDNGDNHIIVLEAGMKSERFYCMPSPKDMGWKNVTYSFHYNRNRYSSDDTPLSIDFSRLKASSLQYEVPIFIGEFSVNNSEYFTLYRDIFECYGWSWAFWTYKKIENVKGSQSSNWSLYGSLSEIPKIDFSLDDFGKIKLAFESMETNPEAKNTNLSNAIIAPYHWKDPDKQDKSEIYLSFRNAILMRSEKYSNQMEWNIDSPNTAYWASNDSVTWKFNVQKDGVYEAILWMSNGVKENIASVWVDGVLANEVAINITAGWQDYRYQPMGQFNLSQGTHTLSITRSRSDKNYSVQNSSFLNIRLVSLKPFMGNESEVNGSEIDLNTANFDLFQTGSGIHIEWLDTPPFFRFMKSNGGVTWSVNLKPLANESTNYNISIEYATPYNNTTLNLSIDGDFLKSINLVNTTRDSNEGDIFKPVNYGSISIPEIKDNITITWQANGDNVARSLRRVHLYRNKI